MFNHVKKKAELLGLCLVPTLGTKHILSTSDGYMVHKDAILINTLYKVNRHLNKMINQTLYEYVGATKI